MGGRVTGALLVAAALLMSVGCGGDDGGDDGGGDAAGEESTTTEATTTTAGETTTTEAPSKPWYNLLEGDCIEALPGGSGFTDVQTIDCGQPHEGEVVFTGQPGNAGPEGRCTESFAAYAGQELDGSGFEVTWFSASDDQPPAGGGVPALPPAGAAGADLMVVCVAASAEGTSTGSLAG